MNSTKFLIGGKERKFTLGLYALGEILRHYDTDIIGLGQLMVKNPYSITATCLYYGHVAALRGQPINFTIQDVYDWLEEMENPLNDKRVAHAISIFVQTVSKHLPKQEDFEQAEEAEKKS